MVASHATFLDFVRPSNYITRMKTRACITVSLPDDVLGAIDEIKVREERTRSQIVDRLLRAGLAVRPLVAGPSATQSDMETAR